MQNGDGPSKSRIRVSLSKYLNRNLNRGRLNRGRSCFFIFGTVLQKNTPEVIFGTVLPKNTPEGSLSQYLNKNLNRDGPCSYQLAGPSLFSSSQDRPHIFSIISRHIAIFYKKSSILRTVPVFYIANIEKITYNLYM